MHRHGYQGRKFGRKTDQRRALIKSLSEALIINGSIETTLPKAKALVPYMEKLITKAKKGDLHNRRQIISSLQTIASAHKLVDEIAPQLTGRSSGHLRIERTELRRGDNAEMARVSFVDTLTAGDTSAASAAAATTSTRSSAAGSTAKAKTGTAAKPKAKEEDDAKPAARRAGTGNTRSSKGTGPQAARRTGVRGNR
jgi:large subunit ribosomal protein L17